MSASGPSKSSSSSSSTETQLTGSSTGNSSPIVATTGSGSPITFTDDGAIAAAAEAVKAALDTASKTNTNVITAATTAGQGNTDLLNTVLSAQAALAANTQSGGQTDQNKTILYVVGAAFAALVLIFLFKR